MTTPWEDLVKKAGNEEAARLHMIEHYPGGAESHKDMHLKLDALHFKIDVLIDMVRLLDGRSTNKS